MATLTSNNSMDKIMYNLDLGNSVSNFKLLMIENIQNNLKLVSTMRDRLIEENIDNVSIQFNTKGGRYVDDLGKETEQKNNKNNKNNNPVKNKVWKWNPVCYIPPNHDVRMIQCDKEGNKTYVVHINDFLKFYKANLDNIASRTLMNSQSFDNFQDEDGFTTVRNVKSDRSRFVKSLEEEIKVLSGKVRTKLKSDGRIYDNVDKTQYMNDNTEELILEEG